MLINMIREPRRNIRNNCQDGLLGSISTWENLDEVGTEMIL